MTTRLACRLATADDWPAIVALKLEQLLSEGRAWVTTPDTGVWTVVTEHERVVAAIAATPAQHFDYDARSTVVLHDLYAERSRAGRRGLAVIFCELDELARDHRIVAMCQTANRGMCSAMHHHGFVGEAVLWTKGPLCPGPSP